MNTVAGTFKGGREAMIAVVLLLDATGCAQKIDTRGNLADAEAISQIVPGSSTRSTVSELLGSPSTIATFNQDTWYYIGAKTEQVAFFEPEIIDQKVVEVHFDATGVVSDVKVYGADASREVVPVSRVTPTPGREPTLLQQFFGKIGRFNNSNEPGAPTYRRPGPPGQ